jgi:hypothetical protein
VKRDPKERFAVTLEYLTSHSVGLKYRKFRN